MKTTITLKHLEYTECPVCRAEITNLEVDRMHTNREQFESVRFSCGGHIKWVPNFSREEVATQCSKAQATALAFMYEYSFVTTLTQVMQSIIAKAPPGSPKLEWSQITEAGELHPPSIKHGYLLAHQEFAAAARNALANINSK